SLKGSLAEGPVLKAVRGQKALRKLFTAEQRELFAERAPAGIALDDLTILGPIFVLKLKNSPDGYDRRLVTELWLYPDGSRILELSTKCEPAGPLPEQIGRSIVEHHVLQRVATGMVETADGDGYDAEGLTDLAERIGQSAALREWVAGEDAGRLAATLTRQVVDSHAFKQALK